MKRLHFVAEKSLELRRIEEKKCIENADEREEGKASGIGEQKKCVTGMLYSGKSILIL